MTKAELLAALDAAEAGRWDEAHGIVQQDEADETACWIHAVLHAIEGDRGNARYWFARAGKPDRAADDTSAELAAIRAAINA
ncbi:MAG: hypothetical protein KGR24_00340 [Planctomycetes bacterium]|nr:hypothetical protein [Planctomycetota bacterium]